MVVTNMKCERERELPPATSFWSSALCRQQTTGTLALCHRYIWLDWKRSVCIVVIINCRRGNCVIGKTSVCTVLIGKTSVDWAAGCDRVTILTLVITITNITDTNIITTIINITITIITTNITIATIFTILWYWWQQTESKIVDGDYKDSVTLAMMMTTIMVVLTMAIVLVMETINMCSVTFSQEATCAHNLPPRYSLQR